MRRLLTPAAGGSAGARIPGRPGGQDDAYLPSHPDGCFPTPLPCGYDVPRGEGTEQRASLRVRTDPPAGRVDPLTLDSCQTWRYRSLAPAPRAGVGTLSSATPLPVVGLRFPFVYSCPIRGWSSPAGTSGVGLAGWVIEESNHTVPYPTLYDRRW
jgi:hypothetical protein